MQTSQVHLQTQSTQSPDSTNPLLHYKLIGENPLQSAAHALGSALAQNMDSTNPLLHYKLIGENSLQSAARASESALADAAKLAEETEKNTILNATFFPPTQTPSKVSTTPRKTVHFLLMEDESSKTVKKPPVQQTSHLLPYEIIQKHRKLSKQLTQPQPSLKTLRSLTIKEFDNLCQTTYDL